MELIFVAPVFEGDCVCSSVLNAATARHKGCPFYCHAVFFSGFSVSSAKVKCNTDVDLKLVCISN